MIDRLKPLGFALLGVFVVLSLFYAADHRFFFIDDRQAQYFPYGLIIRDALLHGSFPFETIHTVYGGALWLDPQYGLYNLLTLALNFLIDPHALEYSGYLISLVMNMMLAAAVYGLGRAYGLARDWAALFGLMMGINVFIIFYNSDTWNPGIICLIWSLLAWTSLKHLLVAQRHIAWRVLLSGFLIFQIVSAGWPHQYIAFGLVMAVMFFEAWRDEPRRALRLVYAGALAAIFILPVLAPMAAATSYWERGSGFFNNGISVPDLGDILNFSNPAWLPRYRHSYMRVLPVPVFFAGWFVLPLLLFADWRRISAGEWRRHAGLIVVLGGLVLLTFSAQIMGPLRWPVRWMGNVHLVGLLLVFLTVADRLKATRGRVALALGALALTTLAAFLENPAGTPPVLWLTLMPALFICLLPVAARSGYLPAFLGATSIAMIAAMSMRYSSDILFIDHGVAGRIIPVNAAADDGSRGYSLFWGLKTNVDDVPHQGDYMIGASGAYYNVNTINGYSSIFNDGLERIFPGVGEFADFTGKEKPLLAAREPETGATFADLLKIRQMVVEEEAAPDGLPAAQWERRKNAGKYLFAHRQNGHMVLDREGVVTFERRQPFLLPGTVSWHAPDVTVGAGAAQGDAESVDVSSGDKGGAVVFARLYYPGFRAMLDDMPLTVRPLGKLLVAVDMPPHAKGTLRLSFLPPLFGACIGLIGLSLLIWAVFAFREHAKGAHHGRQ